MTVAAQVEHPAPVAHLVWRGHLSGLAERGATPKGYRPEDWRGFLADARRFLAGWGAEAAGLGWSDLGVFGVHREAPVANYAAMGLVPALRGALVTLLSAEHAETRRGERGAVLVFRRHPAAPDAAPIWEVCP